MAKNADHHELPPEKRWTAKVRLKRSSVPKLHSAVNEIRFRKYLNRKFKYNQLSSLNVLLSVFLLCHAATGVSANRPPRFLIDGQTEIVIRLKEGPDTPVGSLIYKLRAIDPDDDVLEFGVRDQIGNDVVEIESTSRNEANIYLAKELDREVRDEYALVLTLTDGFLGDGNFITQSLLILVEDVNDNEPIFKPYPTSLTVREDATPRTLVEVEATDLDEGAYGQVVYHLHEDDGDNEVFSIQTLNGKGIIKLVGELDYEKKSLYQLKVLAVDRANQGRINTGTAAILVKVQDVEDQPPEFVFVTPVTRISEDSPIGTSVMQVRAVDGDRGINNKISYRIVTGSQDDFDIDSTTGVIYSTQILDREDPTKNNGAYILEIMATEESEVRPIPSATTEVTILLIDVNDETPQFRSEKYVCEIVENAQQNTPVTFLQDAIPEVFDYDQGKNGTFELYLEGDKGVFDVTPFRGFNEASFLIRVNDPTLLDYEQFTVLNFSLIAKETVILNPKMSIVPITVHIRDENDNVPEFTEQLYEVSILENCGVGTTVAWVQAFDDDSGNYGTRGIRYTNIGGGIAHLLNLNSVSGVITVKMPGGDSFDRELVSHHYLTVEARDDLGQGNRNTVLLIVNIEDVNDNAPVFLANKYDARLLENEVHFESPLILEARDADLNGTRNSQVQYSIVKGEYKDNFSIDPENGEIKLIGPMDFEQLPGNNGNVRPIHLTVRAKDFGQPPMSSDVPVTIFVQDVNDHRPLFQQAVYKRSIPEDLDGGTSVLEVKAFDSDGSSPNNKIVYRIQNGASDKFVIGSETGIISVAPGADLDLDKTIPRRNGYSLTVVALDGGIGEQQLFSEVLVNITIVDVNNKNPIFEEPGTISIMENTQVGTQIFQAVAHDPDEHSILRYSLDGSSSIARNEEGTLVKVIEYDYFHAFDLNAIDGTLKVVRLLDREKVEIIKLGLLVEDMAAANGLKQTAMATLTILIEDENDNNPKFRKPFYKCSIAENSKNGVSIVRITADDIDKNKSIIYSLEGPRDILDLIHMERETGEIVVANKIDHEVYPWLNLTVKATDSGVPPRYSLAELFIQVLDENDNNPYFIFELGNITVPENTPPGTVIAVVSARDPDSGEFGKITYLMDRTTAQGKFSLNAENGSLSIVDWLDREEQSAYNLIIEAWDNYQFGYLSGESRNAFKQIHIQVEDVNDNPPVLSLPTECTTVTEFHSKRDPVATVYATDRDDPNTNNGRVVFAIVGGRGYDLFTVYQLPGVYNSAKIMTAQSLKDRYGNYTLIIEASDLGEPSNRVNGEMHLCVTDFNDHAPMFISPPQNVTIRLPENATIGSKVVEVKAIDADIGPNGAVRYRFRQDIAGNWRTFTIDSTSGIILLRQSLDREKQKIYELRIEAYDLGIPTPLSSDLDLIIYIQNVNNYKPRFIANRLSVNFTEHCKPCKEYVQLPDVIERDEVDILDDPVVPVCYYILKGNEKNIFELDRITHRLSTIKEIDREISPTFELLVLATEDCLSAPSIDTAVLLWDESLETILKVIVNVNDINDNPPKFVSRIFTGGITTAANFGTEFMHIKAIDPDHGENATVTYYQLGDIQRTLSEGLENLQVSPFLVHKDTGAVILNFDPQKGMKGYFDFMVMANDTGGLSDVAHVFIYLLREDQRVKFVLRQHPSEIRDKVRLFRERLATVTEAIVNVDNFRVHENNDGSVDNTKTDLYMHLVDGRDHSVLEVEQVLKLVDKNIEQLDTLFKDFNVLDTQPAEFQPLSADVVSANQTTFWLVSTSLFLGILLILCIMVCLSQRADYIRKLKAANATAYESTMPGESDMTMRSSGGRVPNTNKHSTRGSNPIWLHAYENDWYKNDQDQMSQSEQDSLDENVVVQDTANEKPYFITTGAFPSLENSLGSDVQTNQVRYDIYQRAEQINTKNLETTEL